jgi:hypothetical protein
LARRLLKEELPYDPFLRGKVMLDPSNSVKAKKLKTALLLLVFVPHFFLLAYIALKVPELMEAFRGFVAAQPAGR